MSADPPINTAAMTATLGLVFSLDVRNLGLVTVQVVNLAAGQTFSGFLRRKVAGGLTESTSTMPDFALIQAAGSVDADGNPTDSVTADIDVEGSAVLELYGKMSGGGGDIQWSARKAGPKR